MIETVAGLLDAIANREVARLDALGITHRPTIGGMYEGLTADMVGTMSGVNFIPFTRFFPKSTHRIHEVIQPA